MATQQNRGLATENQRGADAAGAGADARRELGEVNDIVEHSAQAKTSKLQGNQSGKLACIAFEHIELPEKLLNYFLRSNKSNIIQYVAGWPGCHPNGLTLGATGLVRSGSAE